jgi:hypothetical protein
MMFRVNNISKSLLKTTQEAFSHFLKVLSCFACPLLPFTLAELHTKQLIQFLVVIVVLQDHTMHVLAISL